MLKEYEDRWYIGAEDARWHEEVALGQRDLFTLAPSAEHAFVARVYLAGVHRVKVGVCSVKD